VEVGELNHLVIRYNKSKYRVREEKENQKDEVKKGGREKHRVR
jgi:hypothetical protein